MAEGSHLSLTWNETCGEKEHLLRGFWCPSYSLSPLLDLQKDSIFVTVSFEWNAKVQSIVSAVKAAQGWFHCQH